MDEKLVSIIIPCYNGEKFIDRCLMSVLQQTCSKIECIVIDDGSFDNSRKKIFQYEEKFRKKNWTLKYYYQENQGPGAAVNAGLKMVTGDYLILLDVDDEYLPGALKEKAEFLSNNEDIYAVRSNGWMINGDRKFLFIYEEEEKKIEDVFMALLCGKTNNWAGSFMVRADKLFEFYPEREIYKSRYGQNLQLLLPLVYKRKCGYIDKPHMNYIRQENSLSNTSEKKEVEKKDLENLEGYTDIRKYMTKLIVKDEAELRYILKEIDKAYWRAVMSISFTNKNNVLMKQAYRELGEIEKLSIDDKICYANLISPSRVWILRGIRKIQKIFGIKNGENEK